MMSTPLGQQEQKVADYYNNTTDVFFVLRWNKDHIHFGLFEPGEKPNPGEALPESAGLIRALERMVIAIVQPAQIVAQDRVVDAGCGVGGAVLTVAQTYGCSVIGVNVSQRQVDIARSRILEAGLEDSAGAEFADCSSHLPFADSSVDVIMNIESACHYSNRTKFFAECMRILKPHGRLVAADWMATDGISPQQYQKTIQPICDAWFLFSLETRTTYTSLLNAAGFEVLEFVDFGEAALDNARILDQEYRTLLARGEQEQLSEGHLMAMEQFRSLSSAWLSGDFCLQRYSARKSGSA